MKQREPHGTRSFRDHRECQTLTSALFDQWPDHTGSGGRVHDYPKGAFLWTEADRHHAVYRVRRGQVAILLNDAGGCELIVRVVSAGEPFGELCFCAARSRPRQNCARAVVDSSVEEIDFSSFEAYLRHTPAALEAFAFTLCERLADAEGHIEVLSHQAADVRLGRLLLQLATKRGVTSADHPGAVRLPVGHEELARMAAMSRPHVTVTMGKLRALQLLHYGRRTQLTVDLAKLSAYLDQGPIARAASRDRLITGGSHSTRRSRLDRSDP